MTAQILMHGTGDLMLLTKSELRRISSPEMMVPVRKDKLFISKVMAALHVELMILPRERLIIYQV